MELGVRQFRWHEFHGIPWNLECANFADTRSSMEFHGTNSAPISMTRAVPWNSMELWSAPISLTREVPWNSMELPCTDQECANFDDKSSSMEFHGIPWNLKFHAPEFRWHEKFHGIPWNSLELGVRQFRWNEKFHGIPWNSMELRMRQFRWHEQFHGIPWNSMEPGVRQFRWQEQFHGIQWNSMELWVRQFRWLAAVPRNSMEFHGT